MSSNRLVLNLYKGVLLMASLMASVVATAQSVTNVDANQEGKSIAITYDLNETANISLFVTQDGGKTKTAIPLQFTSGNVGKKVPAGTGRKILWRVLDQYPNQNFRGENMSFIVKGKPCMRLFTMVNAGYSLDSGFNAGLTVGQIGSIGWYTKVMTTLAFPKPADFECDANGYVDGIMPAYSGLANSFKIYGVGGVNVRLGVPVYLNAGIGYGSKSEEWMTTDGRWIKNRSKSYRGLAIDTGIMGKLNSIVVSAGATFLSGNVDLYAGIGYVF